MFALVSAAQSVRALDSSAGALRSYIIDQSSQFPRQRFVVREQRRLEQKAYFSTGCGSTLASRAQQNVYLLRLLSGIDFSVVGDESVSQRLRW